MVVVGSIRNESRGVLVRGNVTRANKLVGGGESAAGALTLSLLDLAPGLT